MTGPDVVTFGETMVSLRTGTVLRLGGTLSMTMAGAESNVAIGLARLGHTVRWCGRVGADEVGAFILRTLRAESVAVDTVVVDVSRVSYYRAGSAGSALSATGAAGSVAEALRILHVTGITPALSPSAADAVAVAVRAARVAGTLVSVDINYRSKLWPPEQARPVLSELVRSADIVIASEDELGLVAPAGEAGVSHPFITRGARGATVWQDGAAHDAPAVPIVVRETIGAGDAFTAGYLSGVLDGLSPAGALHRGTVVGAFAVAAVGDWEGLPTRSELALLDTEAGSTLR